MKCRTTERDRRRALTQRTDRLGAGVVVELLEAFVEELLSALEPSRQPERARHEPPDRAVANRAHALGADPPSDGAREVQEVPTPRAGEVEPVFEAA
jgi:hypothetical protein